MYLTAFDLFSNLSTVLQLLSSPPTSTQSSSTLLCASSPSPSMPADQTWAAPKRFAFARKSCEVNSGLAELLRFCSRPNDIRSSENLNILLACRSMSILSSNQEQPQWPATWAAAISPCSRKSHQLCDRFSVLQGKSLLAIAKSPFSQQGLKLGA